MARRVFYSFHYQPDCSRASQVRNMGVIEGNRPATDNEWEAITRSGEKEIKRWIKDQLAGKACCVVLIGQNTAGRKWITHEISEAWNEGKGVLGIHIYKLKDLDGRQAFKGNNPISYVKMNRDGKALSTITKTYDPPYSDSKQVYRYIATNLSDWIEEAVRIRTNY